MTSTDTPTADPRISRPGWSLTIHPDGSVSAVMEGQRLSPDQVAFMHGLDPTHLPFASVLSFIALWREHAPGVPVALMARFATPVVDQQARVAVFREFLSPVQRGALVPLLAHDPHPQMRAAVAGALKKGAKNRRWFDLLASDRDDSVVKALVRNPNTPNPIVVRFADAQGRLDVKSAAMEALRERRGETRLSARWF